jgi:ribosomal protein L36
VAAMKVDSSMILTIDKDIKEYHEELKLIIDLQKEVQVICTDNMDYA